MKKLALLAVTLLAGRASAQSVAVTAATYGGNVGAPHGNVTTQLATACNAKVSCDYQISAAVLGDPVPQKAKNYVAEWACSGVPHSITVPAEAGFGTVITLSCAVPPTPIPTPTPIPGLGPRGYQIHYICSPACSTLDLELRVGQRANGSITVSVSPLP